MSSSSVEAVAAKSATSSLTVVVKLGGNAVVSTTMAVVAADVAAMLAAGHRVLIVHGGGPQVSALQQRLGQQPRKVSGRRITDEAALDALKMAVGGRLNIDVCAALLAAGVNAVGLSGASSGAVQARRRPPRVITGAGDEPIDLGLVGDVVGINRALFDTLMGAGYAPVLACIGAAADGQLFNINADVVANRVAVELSADALMLVSDIRGVLADINDSNSRLAQLDRADFERAVADGVVAGGMIPKLEESFVSIAAGVRRVHIIGQLQPGQLLHELTHPGAVGTALVAPESTP